MYCKTEQNNTICLTDIWEHVTTFGEYGTKNGAFFWPASLCEDRQQHILVADEFNHRIQKFDLYGTFIESHGSYGSDMSQFRYPSGVCVDDDGLLWIADKWNQRVCALDPDWERIVSIGPVVAPDIRLKEPRAVFVRAGIVFVLDEGSGSVLTFGTDGTFINRLGGRGFSKEYYQSDSFKNGFIYGLWKGSASRFNTIETRFHTEGYTIGVFEIPRGLYGNSSLYVADPGNRSIVEMDLEGKILGRWHSMGRDFSGSASDFCAHGVLEAHGALYMHNAAGRLARLEKRTGKVEEIETMGTKVTALVRGREDRIWLLDGWNQKISQFLEK